MGIAKNGRLCAICISKEKGTQKSEVASAELRINHGIVGDAHAGDWHRQVSLLSLEDIEAFRLRGADVKFGDFGENLVLSGIDFDTVLVGCQLSVGRCVLEVTQIGKECHHRCKIYDAVGDCIMPRRGIFAKVLVGGGIEVGDDVGV